MYWLVEELHGWLSYADEKGQWTESWEYSRVAGQEKFWGQVREKLIELKSIMCKKQRERDKEARREGLVLRAGGTTYVRE